MTLELSRNLYQLPVSQEAITELVIENMSHIGPYEGSIDYAVPLDTPVYAAADGTVTRAYDASDKYGDNPVFGPLVNYVTIQHDNGELSEYLHLAKGSIEVTVGQKIQAGHLLARTGLSGWLTAPHLHFMVYQHDDSPEGFHCVRIRIPSTFG